ncbi:hypothetical protein PR202_gb18071 [Eleusine coracana subsp. coracana]|uniref:Uncharacterized protein n=1 Tax=Eleusine coracana subsp. coracana TaxID=191504 RepID=A0AAV5F4Q0_ELECO|nr:hypothetical protein QOZ80_6BG0459580 [Eleusine coracana subsp. coracana]GJN29753.1 hypothetical protein PR202_gb18004 [Eleusine coracana subsp. coracana]GJN29816.1 hypothetical protein PR202_gb18071 [Eleusine coracana subsp. coracana]
MDKILLMSVVGAPGGVFGPGMCVGAMDVFAPTPDGGRGRNKAEAGGGGAAGPAAGAARPAAAKDGRREQRQRGADTTGRFGPASDARCGFLEFVVPY